MSQSPPPSHCTLLAGGGVLGVLMHQPVQQSVQTAGFPAKGQGWRCRDSNPGPFACEANALPLSHIPQYAGQPNGYIYDSQRSKNACLQLREAKARHLRIGRSLVGSDDEDIVICLLFGHALQHIMLSVVVACHQQGHPSSSRQSVLLLQGTVACRALSYCYLG